MPQPRTPATTLPWPTIPSPTSPLSLTQISPGISIIDSLFSPKTLQSFISFLSTSSQITWVSPTLPKKGEATRTNHRFSIQDPNFARELWETSGLRDVCERDGLEGKSGRKPVGLNKNIRCYRYEKGSFFGRMSSSLLLTLACKAGVERCYETTAHYDDDFFDPETGATSEWTLLIYLSGKENGVVGALDCFPP